MPKRLIVKHPSQVQKDFFLSEATHDHRILTFPEVIVTTPMLSRFTGKSNKHVPPSTPASAEEEIDVAKGPECNCSAALHKLTQENQQLRRELQDAHYRIRELESSLAAVYISNGDDDSSVEVQSVDISVTSSASTIRTGSRLADEKRAEQQQRDDRETLKTSRRADKVCRDKRRFRRNKNLFSLDRSIGSMQTMRPLREHSTKEQTMADLSTLFESDSDSLFGSDSVSCSSISESDVQDAKYISRENELLHDRKNVEAYTSGYFMRVNQSDDESDTLSASGYEI